MKKSLAASMVAAALLSSCSLLQRNPADADGGQAKEEAVTDIAPAGVDAEISRMSTKISALETKVDSLTADLQKAQMKNAQPVIEAQGADGSEHAAMAAPVEDLGEPPFAPSEVPAPASVKPSKVVHETALPMAMKTADAAPSVVEKEFRGAMDLFQSGQNLEAASRFALFAKKYPHHLLAAHALYWAGEASLRGQQWALATQNWEEMQRLYPHSTYIPESLAGLAHASEKQGDVAKGKLYKAKLLQAFPKSPAALSLDNGTAPREEASVVNHRAQFNDESENVPVFSENGRNTASEESHAPRFDAKAAAMSDGDEESAGE